MEIVKLLISLCKLLLNFISLTLIYVETMPIIDHFVHLDFGFRVCHKNLLGVLLEDHIVEVVRAQVLITFLKEYASLGSVDRSQ